MVDYPEFFLTLGGLFLLGLMTDLLGRKTALPRVSLLLLFGVLVGPEVFDIIPEIGERWFPVVADMALVMIGFLLGGQLTVPFLKSSGRQVVWISISVIAGTAILVTAGMLLIGQSLPVALLLGAVATSTDPAATLDVVHETSAGGTFTETMIGIAGIDDLWGLLFFTLILSVAVAVTGAQGVSEVIWSGLWEMGGAILLGGLLGLPMAYLSGRIRPGEPTLVEALGFVFLCAGIAFWTKVSFLLASMTMGATVVNVAKHHSRPFSAIEGIEWPFLTLFFVLSGASLQITSLVSAGGTFIVYVVTRILGRFWGAKVGAMCSGADKITRKRMWKVLLPQAGVALGMALYACQRFPDLSHVIMPVVISGTVVFELFGPILTKRTLIAIGETHPADADR